MPGPNDNEEAPSEEIPEFMKKGPGENPEEEAAKKHQERVSKEIEKRVGIIEAGGRGSAKSDILMAKMKEVQRGIVNPDFKPITSEELLRKTSNEEKAEWKKLYAPRELPKLGWHCADAYKIYKYQSEVTGLVEWIWNSRDGVTPFTMVGKDGTKATHVDFWEDMYCPNYVPAVGTRIWADRPDFDPTKHQFNLQIVEVDQVLHNMFRHQASFTPWRPDLIRRG